MGASVRIEADSGIAVVTCEGVLGADDARQGARLLWNHPEWPGRAAVWDFRGARFDLAASDIQRLAEFIKEHQPKVPPEKVAFVTDRNVDFGLARMFEAYRQDSRTGFRVFRNIDEALTWSRTTDADAP